MNRCVVFDRGTGESLASKLSGRVEWHEGRDVRPDEVIALAIAAPGASAAVVPAGDGEKALLLRFTRRARRSEVLQIAGTRLAPSGFLGLSDEVELDAAPEPPKKWWQKILD